MRLWLLCLAVGLLVPASAVDTSGPVVYDETAAKYMPLEKWLHDVDSKACSSNARADLLFAIDGSESVSLNDFHLVVKSVVFDTISRLEIGENFIQVGVLVFSSHVTQTIPIGKYSSKLDLLGAVSRLTYDGGYTAIDAAVEGCIAELSRRQADLAVSGNETASAETRKRIVIFLTDGMHSGSFGVYLLDLLAQLHRRVTAAIALGLQKSNDNVLQKIASDAGLVFDPTAYPDYQSTLYSLLNMRCTAACYNYEQQEAGANKVIATLVQYVNYLIGNFASYHKQESSLLDYARSVKQSVAGLEADIEQTCNAKDNGLLRRIVTLRDSIRTETNGSGFAGASIEAYAGEMMTRLAKLQRETFDQSQSLATEKTKLAGLGVEEERLKADFQTRLDSKASVRKAQEDSLAALEARIAAYRNELRSVTESISRFANISAQLSSRLSRQEAVYVSRQNQLTSLTQESTILASVKHGGSVHLNEMSNKLAQCQSHLRYGRTVLFAIRCGSGAEFESLFSREDSSFSKTPAFEGLDSTKSVYKSEFLHKLHNIGYFRSITWQFLDSKGAEIGHLTMDTSRSELSSVFARSRVTDAFPWVTSYVNSIYRASLDQFRPQVGSEFLLVFGSLERYRATGSCSDLVGVFIVLTAPHRCYPEAVTFPQVYVSPSPFGGTLSEQVFELRLTTSRLPADRPQPTHGTTGDEQLTEVLLFVKAGAGYLHSLLLTSRFTPAALLADVDDLSQLARHYKSSLLSGLKLDSYRAIKLELFDANGRVLAALRFKGPFSKSAANNTEGAFVPMGWEWFQPMYLDASEPFSVEQLRQSRFSFYNGVEFFTIGEQLAESDCTRRRYFLTLVDGTSSCPCFSSGGETPPSIFFANNARPLACNQLTSADSLRLTGELLQPLRSSASGPDLAA
ncbi:hypothetical protein BOX15_Mlig024859g2 [Macrostomum lignano]|uniref:VWFA domain-containing protein n=1 Tax=Macrostomum lignano TaxID=282301 RepID=A0A267FBL1_9PLAT|nr:hypothetical protein BOX15_Mlig024859g3 [Macrostomum lignano]PAA71888.1 hypothetical protein BOX15_Mlig024859g2 [Macrostomum lignano]